MALIKLIGKAFVIYRKCVKTVNVFSHVAFIVYSICMHIIYAYIYVHTYTTHCNVIAMCVAT